MLTEHASTPSQPNHPDPVVDVVIPVFNESGSLRASIERLHDYLASQFPLPWVITIVDNASTDRTWPIACELVDRLAGVGALHLHDKGRGRALRTAWSSSDATVVTYMDVDLSTDLRALLPLVAPLVSGHSDIAIGTRLAPSARVIRGPKREMISRGYNVLLRATLHNAFSDAQCGFKAMRADVARELLPLVEDQGWFFDTELLVLAERSGLRIHEVPVDWIDDPDSRVDVVTTAKGDLQGVWRMLRRSPSAHIAQRPSFALIERDVYRDGWAAQLARFVSIGIVSTILFAALFLLLHGLLGAVGADLAALLICSVANTAANRRLTFALRGRINRNWHYGIGIGLGMLPVAFTLGTLGLLTVLGVASTAVTVAVLTAMSAAGGMVRFLVLRRWVFGHRP